MAPAVVSRAAGGAAGRAGLGDRHQRRARAHAGHRERAGDSARVAHPPGNGRGPPVRQHRQAEGSWRSPPRPPAEGGVAAHRAGVSLRPGRGRPCAGRDRPGLSVPRAAPPRRRPAAQRVPRARRADSGPARGRGLRDRTPRRRLVGAGAGSGGRGGRHGRRRGPAGGGRAPQGGPGVQGFPAAGRRDPDAARPDRRERLVAGPGAVRRRRVLHPGRGAPAAVGGERGPAGAGAGVRRPARRRTRAPAGAAAGVAAVPAAAHAGPPAGPRAGDDGRLSRGVVEGTHLQPCRR